MSPEPALKPVKWVQEAFELLESAYSQIQDSNLYRGLLDFLVQ